MSTLLGTSAIVLAIGIVLVLAFIAYRLQSQVRAMEQRKSQELEELAKQQVKHEQYLQNSIRILSQGIVDKQVTLTEGSIRISVLLDNLKVDDTVKEEFNVFYQLAEATAHIPILDAWKKLSSKERYRFDKERLNAESKFGDFAVDAAKRLKDYDLSAR